MNTALLVSFMLLVIVIYIGGVDSHRFSRSRVGRWRMWGRNRVCPRHYCKNGGVCRRRGRSYYCRCPRGFNGRRCECEIDECATEANTCDCNSKCVNIIGGPGVTCECLPGFTGPHCDCEIDECATEANTCEGNSQCVNIIGGPGITCECPTGFTGQNCETNCASFEKTLDVYPVFSFKEVTVSGQDCTPACQQNNCTALIIATGLPESTCSLYFDPIFEVIVSSVFQNDFDACEAECANRTLCVAAASRVDRCFLFKTGFADLTIEAFEDAFIVEKAMECTENM